MFYGQLLRVQWKFQFDDLYSILLNTYSATYRSVLIGYDFKVRFLFVLFKSLLFISNRQFHYCSLISCFRSSSHISFSINQMLSNISLSTHHLIVISNLVCSKVFQNICWYFESHKIPWVCVSQTVLLHEKTTKCTSLATNFPFFIHFFVIPPLPFLSFSFFCISNIGILKLSGKMLPSLDLLV